MLTILVEHGISGGSRGRARDSEPSLFCVQKKKSQQEEKPTGKAKENRPLPPLPTTL